jgi:glycosyltransferase involved in cell wall biosynthesis
MVGALWVLYMRWATQAVPGWASTLLPLFMLSGVQLLILGLIGEYIGRLYVEVKQRPLFLVREELHHEQPRIAYAEQLSRTANVGPA